MTHNPGTCPKHGQPQVSAQAGWPLLNPFRMSLDHHAVHSTPSSKNPFRMSLDHHALHSTPSTNNLQHTARSRCSFPVSSESLRNLLVMGHSNCRLQSSFQQSTIATDRHRHMLSKTKGTVRVCIIIIRLRSTISFVGTTRGYNYHIIKPL